MFAHKKPEVLVVGAGPVGLCTALALVHRGVRVQIVDREPRTGTHSYALALHAEAMRVLERHASLDELLAGALRVRRVGIYDRARRRGEMRISDLPEDHSFLAVLPQGAFEERLVAALSHRGVRVDWCHEVPQIVPHADRVDVTIDRLALDTLGYSVQESAWVVAKSRRHEFPFVVGADGLSSVVRRRLDIEFPSVGPSSDFEVFEFKTDADLGDELRLVLDGQRLNACWPLPDGYCRWSFEVPVAIAPEERRKERDLIQAWTDREPGLDERRLGELLAERAPWFRGTIAGIRWCKRVHFERRLAASFGSGRIALLGDAAHLTGPVGIHSMNVGLREGAELAALLATALHGNRGLAELDAFHATRRAEWRGLLGIDPLLHAGPDTDPWLAAAKDRLLPCIPATGNDLALLAAQLGFTAQLPAAASH